MILTCRPSFLPIVAEVGFLEHPAYEIAQGDQTWRMGLGKECVVRPLYSGVEDALQRLLPLCNSGTRSLLLPTRSPWTAYLDNGLNGTDVVSYQGRASRHYRCRTIRAVAAPNLKRVLKGNIERGYESVQFAYREPEDALGTLHERVIGSTQDGGWAFDLYGTPFPFEEMDAYERPRKQDRFTVPMLRRYLKALGIDAFDLDFYVATKENPAYLVEYFPTWEVTTKTLAERQMFRYGMVVDEACEAKLREVFRSYNEGS